MTFLRLDLFDELEADRRAAEERVADRKLVAVADEQHVGNGQLLFALGGKIDQFDIEGFPSWLLCTAFHLNE